MHPPGARELGRACCHDCGPSRTRLGNDQGHSMAARTMDFSSFERLQKSVAFLRASAPAMTIPSLRGRAVPRAARNRGGVNLYGAAPPGRRFARDPLRGGMKLLRRDTVSAGVFY